MIRATFKGQDLSGTIRHGKTYNLKVRLKCPRSFIPELQVIDLEHLKPYVYVYSQEEKNTDSFLRSLQYESFGEMLVNWRLYGKVVE